MIKIAELEIGKFQSCKIELTARIDCTRKVVTIFLSSYFLTTPTITTDI